jgi:uncharacterized membrane protein
MQKSRSLKWIEISGYLLLALYVLVFSWLSIQQHRAFHTRALDLGQFDQAIWNTTHGRFFVNTLKPPNTLAYHFSPLMALISPLYLVWPDIRLLFVIQTVALALAGLPLFQLMRERNPTLAPLVLAAYYLNPALHEVNLSEFRRITLAVPFISLALYGLIKGQRRWILGGLLLALLCKENVAILVMAFGVYLLLKNREVKLGGGLLILGLLWAIIVPFVVVPRFGSGTYPQLAKYYSYLGGDIGEALKTLSCAPLIWTGNMLAMTRLEAVIRLLLPTGFLVFLAPTIFALSFPSLGYMLASDAPSMYGLRSWYPASLLPILFFAAAIGLERFKHRQRQWATLYLLTMSVIGYWLYSPAPLTRGFQPDRFIVTEHARWGEAILARVPLSASVSAQDALVPHLSHREEVYLYPRRMDEAQYIALDTQSRYYPLTPDPYEMEFQKLLANPDYRILAEADGYFLFQQAEGPSIEHLLETELGQGVALLGFDIGAKDEHGEYISQSLPLRVSPGQTIRLSLYWQSVAEMDTDYTVFTHLLDDEGHVVGQHDELPGNGFRLTEIWQPAIFKLTSRWQPGEIARDVHYLSLSPDCKPGTGALEVGMYNRWTGQRLSTANGEDHLILTQVIIGREGGS